MIQKGSKAPGQALKKLRVESESFNKAYTKMTDPQNTRKQAMFAKEIGNSSTNMFKLGKATESTSKIMRDLFIRRLDEEKKALNEVDKALSRVSKSYSNRESQLKSAIAKGDMSGAAGIQRNLASKQNIASGLQAQKMDIESAIKAMEDPGIKSRLIGLVAGIATAGRNGSSWCQCLPTSQNSN